MTDDMHTAIDKAKTKDGHATIQAPPIFHEDVRTKKKYRAGSTRADALHAWLDTADGKEWILKRRKRLALSEPTLL